MNTYAVWNSSSSFDISARFVVFEMLSIVESNGQSKAYFLNIYVHVSSEQKLTKICEKEPQSGRSLYY